MTEDSDRELQREALLLLAAAAGAFLLAIWNRMGGELSERGVSSLLFASVVGLLTPVVLLLVKNRPVPRWVDITTAALSGTCLLVLDYGPLREHGFALGSGVITTTIISFLAARRR
jgi:hypothetical protein